MLLSFAAPSLPFDSFCVGARFFASRRDGLSIFQTPSLHLPFARFSSKTRAILFLK
jgi:hypothetical protein